MRIRRVQIVLFRILKVVFLLISAFYCFITAVVALHWGLDMCPFHLKTFKRSQLIPVVYGLPTMQSLARASRGEIVLGGCMIRSLSAICPYCRFPARFALSGLSSSSLDKETLKGLSEAERENVKGYAEAILREKDGDNEERVTAFLVAETDVWFGTIYDGLRRLDWWSTVLSPL